MVVCDRCFTNNFASRWSFGSCYNCGADLPVVKPYLALGRKIEYPRKPFSDDPTLDYRYPPWTPKTRDLFPEPTPRIDALRYTNPYETRDISYPSDSAYYTPRRSRRHEKSTYFDDRKPDFRREKTDIRLDRFVYKPIVTVEDAPPSSRYLRDETSIKPKLTREVSSSKPRFCSYQNLCREYVWSLKWPREYFNSRFNRCYCSRCYPATFKDVYETGGATYVIPRDWVRFGLYVDAVKADCENIWDRWIVTYHGTKIPAAESIISHRQFLLPGDTCDDGTVIGIRPGHIPGKKQVYTSPTIKYSSLRCYCDRYNYLANDGKRYEAKIVLQCRQQPGTYQTQPETVGSGSKRICKFIPNEEIEIFTTVRAAVVPYGLLVQLIPI